MAYSKDYRRRAVEYKEEGHTFEELREVFKIPPKTYYDWKEKNENGYYEEKRKIPKEFISKVVERKRLIDKEKLAAAIEEKPDAYLHELAELFGCTAQAIFYALAKMKVTVKKRHLPTRKNQKKREQSI